MSDCRFGVSPVNYPDPDPGGSESSLGAHAILLVFVMRRLICLTHHVNTPRKCIPECIISSGNVQSECFSDMQILKPNSI